MDFQLSDDQRALRSGMRDLLGAVFDRDRLRAAVERDGALDRSLWRELGAAGFFALRLPEEAGGVGLGLPEAVLLFEEAGRALLPGPLVATHLAAGLVKGAAEGEAVVTAVAWELPVAHLAEADAVLVGNDALARDPLVGEALRAFVAAARPVRSMDPLTPLHRAPADAERAPAASERTRADAERAPAATERAPAHAGRFRFEAALLTAAEQLGSAARTTEAAVQHAGEREQFGSPIGSFQAVKHLCADMLARTEPARAAVYAAAVTGDPVEIAAAKLLADEAAVRNARDCLQIHGGMGFTWEADVHLHLKRAWLRAASWLTGAGAEELLAAGLGTVGRLPRSSAAYGRPVREAGGGG
ncbi:acyl-CoA/acyl-ACP dehydrogenase [Streptomyces sp. MBT67]|uniref:acyl-CoA dehydrogenase family protein n=1 Tax=unclassified Streptomyces TaxID=2593676 RepID=UPI00190BA21B|nr:MULTISPECIES: acyl-CoA dehydrogenase family protein [unclassified Streptomyces]MBK3532281.1 acyl-CoA/acyl-ACP dehydrogenase [Streptomyces sp. MBT72]MBK3538352.1 acyl-CoA/acyl-ACP dehydrogenase [Streptomyces sp. MBT67]MBK3549958.1 acyl-CoA/acyl-ACP dehydrogenase [Streptomyces sp. MBT61]MBK6032481.1 acyl-CoA/acyl-ACP dehydrogenase [Streptomyces sp. MBT59]